MVAFPPVLYAASFAQGLPVAAGVFHRGRRLPAPVLWLLVWCTWLVTGDVFALAVVHFRGPNLWTGYLFIPVATGFCLWALSHWQTNGVVQLSFRLAIALLLVPTYLPLLLAGPPSSPDHLVWPLHAFTTLVAALYTLVSRSLRAEALITQQPWFWITLGMSINFGVAVALRPFSEALVETHPEWVKGAYVSKSVIQILAFGLIAWGVRRIPADRSAGAAANRGSDG